MRTPLFWIATLALGAAACDDTAQAVDKESREQAQEAKRVLDAAGRDAKREVKALKRGVEVTADELRREASEAVGNAAEKVDQVDKAVARDVQDDPPARDAK